MISLFIIILKVDNLAERTHFSAMWLYIIVVRNSFVIDHAPCALFVTNLLSQCSVVQLMNNDQTQ